jgi:hypothetical protein
MLEKYFGDILAGVFIMILGSAVVAIVKASVKNSLNTLILSLEERFVLRKDCDRQLERDAESLRIQRERDAEERENIRKDLENHETRLNLAKIGRTR